METYQIGNKVTCIVRAYCPCFIGETALTYKNEPYTILKDLDMTLVFNDKERNATTPTARQLNYNTSTISQVKLSNVHLTSKVLGMLFEDTKEVLKTKYDNVTADEEGKIYLSTSEEKIYQVFIYNDLMNMIQAYGEIKPEDIVLEAGENYLVVYQELGEYGVLLNAPENTYYTLDFICIGNTDEHTQDSYIHIEKAGLRVDRQMYFNRTLNAVDLTFNVIETKSDYITLK